MKIKKEHIVIVQTLYWLIILILTIYLQLHFEWYPNTLEYWASVSIMLPIQILGNKKIVEWMIK